MYRSSICFCWGISYCEGGASNGPEQPRARLSRGLAVPCADRPDGNRSASTNRHAGPVQRNAHQPGDIAGFATAPDRGRGERSAQQSEAAGQRHEQARAVADRADPEIRSAGRERRSQFRLRFAQPQAQEAEILSGAGEAETADRSRQPAAADCVEHAAAAIDPVLGVGQQDADPAGDGGHRGGPAAPQAPQGRRRSVRRGRRLRRQLSGQVRGRSLRRLRHQSRPARPGARQAVLCDRAGVRRVLRLGSPCAGGRSPRLLHRLRRQPHAEPRRHAAVGAARYRQAQFHRPCRWPARRQPRHTAAGAKPPVRFDRQSRQPERAGRPRQISDLHHARRHRRRRPDLQPAAGFSRRHRRPHRLHQLETHRRHVQHQRRPQLQPVWRRRPHQL